MQPPIATTHTNSSHDDGIFLLLNFYLFIALKKNFDNDVYGDGYSPPYLGEIQVVIFH